MASAMFIVLGASTLATTGRAQRTIANKQAAAVAYYGTEISVYQRETWGWERVMGAPPARTAGRVLAEMSPRDLRAAAQMWIRRAHAARVRAHHPPHLREWLCIHRFEGSWTDNGWPYWGGLQMNLGFQRTYGGWLYAHKGTADHWTPLEQMWAAEKAYSSRGFWPWPNTARFCGLL